MKKWLLAILIPGFASLCFLTSCSDDNPAGVPDEASLGWCVVSIDSIPHTLMYGQSITAQYCFYDKDGSAVQVSVSGIVPSLYHVVGSGDSVFVTFNLRADSLEYDSTYRITMHANGGGIDTMTLACAMNVIDTNRLGGVRKPAIGMWWIEHQFDTLVWHLDSLDQGRLAAGDTQHVYVTKKDTVEHHKFLTVTAKIPFGGDSVWVLHSSDTLKREGAGGSDSVVNDYRGIKHTASVLELSTLGPAWFLDTVRYQYLSLPFHAGNTWKLVGISGDTAVRVSGIRLKFSASLTGNNTAKSTVARSYANANRACYSVESATDMNTFAILDTTIRIPGWDTLYAGDTAACSRTRTVNNGNDFFCPDLGVGLGSHTIATQLDTNRYETKVVSDTARKGTFLKALYDPRRGDTLVAQ
jgi:hypothetical protein